MWIATVFGGALLLILGLLIRLFNLSFLIAGYNTSTAKQKSRWNEKKLTQFIGSLLVACGGVLLAGGALIAVDAAAEVALGASWTVFCAVMVWGLIFVNTNQRFKNE